MNEDTTKEVMEQITQVRLDIREVMTELRSLKALDDKVDRHERRITSLENSQKNSQERLNKLDKIVFWITTLIIGAVILGIIKSYF
jgi:prefoldin subunit 5